MVLCWSFLVILAWDNQKGTFWTHFVNFGHEGAPNVTKLTYNMIILWENSPRKKNWGSFVHRGLRYEFLRKKIWTVPLILQFNIFTDNAAPGNEKGRARICKVCGKEGRQSNIRDHIEANHLEGIVLPCNLGEKTFRSRVSLRHHMKVHKYI